MDEANIGVGSFDGAAARSGNTLPKPPFNNSWAPSFSDTESDRTWTDNGAIQDLTSKSGGKRALGTLGTLGTLDSGNEDSDDTLSAKKKRIERFANGKDYFCWCCHREKANVFCSECPRSYHFKCLSANNMIGKGLTSSRDLPAATYVCFNCTVEAKTAASPARKLRKLSPEEFNELLLFALDAVKVTADATFHHAVVASLAPDYGEFVINAVDLESIETKAKKKEYKGVDTFLADINWIVHNCYIYNSHNHPLTTNAKQFYKLAQGKVVDLEICPDCFKNFHVKPSSWFMELCRKPHALVWAKVTGHPFWPGKVVRLSPTRKEFDVRFFGAHDRAWVPVDSCFQITENNCKAKAKGPRSKFDVAVKELNEHIKKIETKYSTSFPYAAAREPLDIKKIYLLVGDLQSEDEEDEEPLPEEEEEEEVPLVINAGDDKKSFTSPPDSQDGSISKQASANGADSSDEKTLTIDEKEAGTKGVFTFTNDSAMDEFKPDLDKGDKAPQCVKVDVGEKGTVSQNDVKTPRAKKPRIRDRRKKSVQMTGAISASPNLQAVSNLSAPVDVTRSSDLQVLQLELERLKRELDDEKKRHIENCKDASDRTEQTISNLRANFSKDKERALSESRHQLEAKHLLDIEQIKKKQWCASCANEAIYYCCWNTSYCTYECQTTHWTSHMASCQQTRQAQHSNQNSSNPGRG